MNSIPWNHERMSEDVPDPSFFLSQDVNAIYLDLDMANEMKENTESVVDQLNPASALPSYSPQNSSAVLSVSENQWSHHHRNEKPQLVTSRISPNGMVDGAPYSTNCQVSQGRGDSVAYAQSTSESSRKRRRAKERKDGVVVHEDVAASSCTSAFCRNDPFRFPTARNIDPSVTSSTTTRTATYRIRNGSSLSPNDVGAGLESKSRMTSLRGSQEGSPGDGSGYFEDDGETEFHINRKRREEVSLNVWNEGVQFPAVGPTRKKKNVRGENRENEEEHSHDWSLAPEQRRRVGGNHEEGFRGRELEDDEWTSVSHRGDSMDVYASSWEMFEEAIHHGQDHEEEEEEEPVGEDGRKGGGKTSHSTLKSWRQREYSPVVPLPPPQRQSSSLDLCKEDNLLRFFPHLAPPLHSPDLAASLPNTALSSASSLTSSSLSCSNSTTMNFGLHVQYRVMHGSFGKLQLNSVDPEGIDLRNDSNPNRGEDRNGGTSASVSFAPDTPSYVSPPPPPFSSAPSSFPIPFPAPCMASSSSSSSSHTPTTASLWALQSDGGTEVLDLRYLSGVFRHADYHHPSISGSLSPSLSVYLAPGVTGIPSPMIRLLSSGKFSIFRVRTEEEGMQAAHHFIRLLHLCPPPPLSLSPSSFTTGSKMTASATPTTTTTGMAMDSSLARPPNRYYLRYLRTATVTAAFDIHRPIRLHELVCAFREGKHSLDKKESEEEGSILLQGQTARQVNSACEALSVPPSNLEENHFREQEAPSSIICYDGWADGDPSRSCCDLTIRLRDENVRCRRNRQDFPSFMRTHSTSSVDIVHCVVHVSGRIRFTGRNEILLNKAFDCLAPWIARYMVREGSI